MDRLTVFHAEWNKSETIKWILYINTCLWNLEKKKLYRWTSLQGRSRDTDVENGPVNREVVKRRVGWIERVILTIYYQFSSVAQSCPTLRPGGLQRETFLSITNFLNLLKLKSTESVMPSNHLILCCPLLLMPSIFPRIRVFSNDSVLSIRWPNYWSSSFSISPSN